MKFNIEAEAEARKKHDPNKFVPMDLNEDSIRAMVERCFARTDDPKDDKMKVAITPDGYSFDGTVDATLTLSKSRSEANKKNIQYLFGQLAVAHKENLSSFSLPDGKLKYDGSIWTKTNAPLLNLLYFSEIFESTLFLLKRKDGSPFIAFNSNNYVPTLSPKDPNFPAWWEEHKAEWED